jgi:glycosyltransferase involved in cell wall biosynthesis
MDEAHRGASGVIPRLVILTEIIAPYRIPVFNALAQRPEISLEAIFLSENDSTLRRWRVYKNEIKFPYHILPSWRRRLFKYNLLLNRKLHSTLNRTQPAIVICGGYNYLASWSAAYWAKTHAVPFLLWTESTALDARRRHPIVEFLKRRFLNLCAGFVVPGTSSLNYLKHLGIAEEKITIAPNAVDNALFSKVAEAARRQEPQLRLRHHLPPRYFLYVGRLVKAKGIFDLLDAYSQLNSTIRSRIGLVFVGDGSDRNELLARASKIATGTIHIAGFTHREELPEIYALAEAFIFPTHTDPWGLVVNEAMACGLPVITSSVAGCAANLVQDGYNGFVVPPRDPRRLAEAMESVVSDSTARAEMARRSRERIEANSPAAWADGIIAAIQRARLPQD